MDPEREKCHDNGGEQKPIILSNIDEMSHSQSSKLREAIPYIRAIRNMMYVSSGNEKYACRVFPVFKTQILFRRSEFVSFKGNFLKSTALI